MVREKKRERERKNEASRKLCVRGNDTTGNIDHSSRWKVLSAMFVSH